MSRVLPAGALEYEIEIVSPCWYVLLSTLTAHGIEVDLGVTVKESMAEKPDPQFKSASHEPV